MLRFVLGFLGSISLLLADGEPLGLSVKNGELTRAGKAYHGIGVNYFDLFARLLRNAEDDSSLHNLGELSRAGIPFVRFMCGGYWPAEQQLFLTNRTLFFERLDRVVHAAEREKIGLIPSFFWHVSTVPDLAGESLDQYGNTNSGSVALIQEYTTAVVSRYRNSPAVLAWEFGNEYNLAWDLPNGSEHRPPVVPRLGTPTSRTERDELKFAHAVIAMRAFAEAVRRIDPHRLLLTGHAAPRPSAWHNVHRGTREKDSPGQFREILLRDNPDPFNSITVHLYPEPGSHYPGSTRTLAECLEQVASMAREAGKPLFLGEFGFSAQDRKVEEVRDAIASQLKAIQQSRVPLAAGLRLRSATKRFQRHFQKRSSRTVANGRGGKQSQ